MDPDEQLNLIINRLRERNYRITSQRKTLLRLLVEDTGHPSAMQLFEQLRTSFPKASLATVYKTLNVLKEWGEIQEISFGDEESRYDMTKPYPHIHLICVQCYSISDVNLFIPNALKKQFESEHHFQVLDQRLDFFGICSECQNDEVA